MKILAIVIILLGLPILNQKVRAEDDWYRQYYKEQEREIERSGARVREGVIKQIPDPYWIYLNKSLESDIGAVLKWIIIGALVLWVIFGFLIKVKYNEKVPVLRGGDSG